jgi:hypothetical protein
LGWSSSI